MAQFLKYGYLGLLGLVVYLCYKLIDSSKRKGQSTAEVYIRLSIFLLVGIFGAVAGFLWSSKELEAVNTKKANIEAEQQQIEKFKKEFYDSITPLQKAVESTSARLNNDIFSSDRRDRIMELDNLNAMIKSREELLNKRIETLRKFK